jgi:hypothetical protein
MRNSENSNENSSKKEDIFSFGVRTNEKGEKESFTDGEEDKDNLEKDGSDDDKESIPQQGPTLNCGVYVFSYIGLILVSIYVKVLLNLMYTGESRACFDLAI